MTGSWDPCPDVAASQVDGFSGIVSFEVKGGLAEARRVLACLRLFKIAESLDGVELPAVMTHASIPNKSARRRESLLNILDNETIRPSQIFFSAYS